MKPIHRLKKSTRRAVQRVLPFFRDAKAQRAFERLMRRREALETRDQRAHDQRVADLMAQGATRQEAESIATVLDHSTRHPHDDVLLGKSRKGVKVRARTIRPPAKKGKINWNIWKRK